MENISFAEILNGFISKYAEILNPCRPKYAEILNWKSRAGLTSEGKATVAESVRRRVLALVLCLLPQILLNRVIEGGFLRAAGGENGMVENMIPFQGD